MYKLLQEVFMIQKSNGYFQNIAIIKITKDMPIVLNDIKNLKKEQIIQSIAIISIFITQLYLIWR